MLSRRTAGAILGPLLVAAVSAGCSSESAAPATTAPAGACAAAMHPWQVGPRSRDESGDGLPHSGTATPAAAEAVLGSGRTELLAKFAASRATVEVQPGRAWVGQGDIVDEDIATIVLTIASVDACPEVPWSWNGIPLSFSLGD